MHLPLLIVIYATYAIVTVYCSLKAILREEMLPNVFFAPIPSSDDLSRLIADAESNDRTKVSSILENYNNIIAYRTLWSEEKKRFEKLQVKSIGAFLLFISFFSLSTGMKSLPYDYRIAAAASYLLPAIVILCMYKRIVPHITCSFDSYKYPDHMSSFTIDDMDAYLQSEARRLIYPLDHLISTVQAVRHNATVYSIIAATLIALFFFFSLV